MKAIVLLLLIFASGFFGWRYLMGRKERRVTSTWGRRAVAAGFFAVATVAALFAVSTLTTWRMF